MTTTTQGMHQNLGKRNINIKYENNMANKKIAQPGAYRAIEICIFHMALFISDHT
jgi:hypothetical protein